MPADHPPEGRAYFPALTGLRGVAAGWVALFHLWMLAGAPKLRIGPIDLTPLFGAGFLGVDLFFVLSGFLLGRPFLAWAQGSRGFPDMREFWKRRALRVLPAFYIQLFILLAVAWFASGASPVSLRQVLAYLSMQFVFIDGVAPLLNGVWWSLPVEWNFYLVLPLLGWLFARIGWRGAVLALLLAAVGYRFACHYWLLQGRMDGLFAYPAIIQLPARIDEFAFGMLVAWFHLRPRAASPRRDNALLLLGLLGAAAIGVVFVPLGDIFATAQQPWIYLYATCAGLALALVVHAAAARAPLARWLFEGRVLAFIGTVSYSLYLWHSPIYGWAYQRGLVDWLPGPKLLSLSLALLPLVLLVSWLSYRCTEHPFLVTAPAARRDAQGSAGQG